MARAFVSLCFSLALCLALVSALDIQGRVAWNQACGNASLLGRAKAVLDDGRYAGAVTHTGHFTIPNVPEGTYILSIISHDHVFDSVRVDVLKGESKPEIRPYVQGTPLDPPSTVLLPYPVTLSAKESFVYFKPPESFNLVSMLSNPMMMMMVVGGVMMLGMPYLMKNLDPEALEELKKNQAQMAGVQNALAAGDLKGGFSAIMTAADEANGEASSSSKPTQKGPVRAPKKGKR
ncbi:hypothetical protein CC1G_03678 [Coprinopsis cinerea okayama7|uniref:ER membrane protein complex subunit 7 beta-sandwich domain-containing protein n=1 Tax=Coprinopsis cinerea (strain Okayama-7 / 130 / ATCC MYA-4618 / FGSC 9003) TaxID=240176 RepID=A8N1Y5_COPC7|nr:hypothetical protein CC1G_03678 [Coprinopsis cinerea okayama7\|eukprot:XP_001828884.1 hypothetical protein CC1G_03678 [Coprinopsis cinerea okayama7\